MMMKLTTFMGVIGLASAASDVFRFKPNNDGSTADNWVNGNLPAGGIVDFSQGCLDTFGETGGTIRLDESGIASEIILPMNGEIVLGDDVEWTITGQADGEPSVWRCKNVLEYHTGCSKNWQMLVGNEYVDAETTPCFNDVVQFDEDTAKSVLWGPGQYLRMIELRSEKTKKSTFYKSTRELEALDDANPRTFQGQTPHLNEVTGCGGETKCQQLCTDVCPLEELAPKWATEANRAKFFALDEEARNNIIKKAAHAQDSMNEIRNAAQTAMEEISNRAGLVAVTKQFQDDYDKEMSEEKGYTIQPGTWPIPQMKISPANLANWMASDQGNLVPNHQDRFIRHCLSKEGAEEVVAFFEQVASGDRNYGVDGAGQPMQLDDDLWKAIAEKGPLTSDGGRFRRAEYASISEFLLARANIILTIQAQVLASDATFQSSSDWEAVAADPTLDFNEASGAFILNNVLIAGQIYVDSNGVPMGPAISPDVLAFALSEPTTFAALFAMSTDLAAANFFKPTTTVSPSASPTISPTISPTMSPTISPTVSPTKFPTISPTFSPSQEDVLAANLIPIAAGGGGGLLLLVIIIVLVIVILGGKKNKEAKDDGRNVVAFENPMYDDPAKNGAAPKAAQEDTGLYDEPTFNQANKANPMYSSNDNEIDQNNGDGYLDVQPDDEDEDDESEDDDE